VPPVDDDVPPVDDEVPPVDDDVPPFEDEVPPVEDEVPPVCDVVPPVAVGVPLSLLEQASSPSAPTTRVKPTNPTLEATLRNIDEPPAHYGATRGEAVDTNERLPPTRFKCRGRYGTPSSLSSGSGPNSGSRGRFWNRFCMLARLAFSQIAQVSSELG
jgi:hypothetical protein